MAPKAWAQTYLIGTNQTACAGTIYDSGGASGNYSNNEDLTSVLTPGTAGSKVSLTFASFATENCCDYLRIYDGPTASAPLIGEYKGATSPGTVYASNSTGQLTLVFHSDGSVVQSGFEAAISCLTNVPSITSFTPANGAVGTSVVITGTGFTGASAVSFNNIAATSFVVNSATQITAVVPAGSTTGPIRVTVNSLTASSSTNFTLQAPTITSFTPTSGPAGTSVVVTGTGFTGATAVTLGGTAVPTFTVNSATQLTLTVPAGAFSGPICVTTPGGTNCSTGSYNTGTQGYLIGTNQTTCTGTIYDSGGPTGNYANSEDLTTVLTPGTAGSRVALNFTSFATESCCDYLRIYDGPTASAPLIGEYKGTTGPGSVFATNATGQLTLVFHSDGSVVASGFEATVSCFTILPTITSFTPTSGAVGTSVTITGTGFTGATGVSFNNVPATTFNVISATQITAVVPTGAATGPIRVTNGVTVASSTNFTVPAPTVTSFTPTSGPAGTSVVLTGTGFAGATAVTLGGTPVTTFTVNSATQITLSVPPNAFSGPICVTTPAGNGCSTGNYATGNQAYLIGTNVTACSGSIFDSGGPTGNYSNSEDLTSVLTPANGSKVVLTFSSFSTESCCDYLRIYDGPTASATLIGEYKGTNSPGTVQASASNTTGQLTLVFHTDGSVVQSGFEAAISCLAPPTCTAVTNLTVTNVTATSATLNFTPGVGNNSYVVTYTPTGGTAQTVTASASPITLNNLISSTPYTVSVQPVCTVGTSPNTTTTATFTTQLPNDEPCGALTLGNTSITSSNVNATTSLQNGINLPACSPAAAPKDVWFTFVATATTRTLTLTGTAAGSVRVYTAANCTTGPFAQVFCQAAPGNNQNVGPVNLTGLVVGTRYYIAVSGYGSSDATGTFTILGSPLAARAQAETEALVVYPNPSNTGQLTLRLSGLAHAGQATLLNALGQTVLTQALSTAAEQTLSTRRLATGVYTLRVTVGEQVLTRKVVLE
ncbi:CUB domain-containing protein [Hymenobacter properus]|uniref:IPT/TIG domain-containing protein n=1 Tax=Hymenobacter properus TaxID=2791026 RepID=A0A931BKP7_9BACT|nr:CUB domain-containing protein [Hymenobacter properus]MBF9143216.1 IPT/TIG domain-containing protein [Hymenobacter properus]MBR7722025.1 IPT/TIG domain-containing protein [Microvirga sp. SRT04]